MFGFTSSKTRPFGRRHFGRLALSAALLGVAACNADPIALDLVLCESGTGPECVDGTLSLTVTGLPESMNASVIVRGPDGFRMTVTSSQTFQVLSGDYTVEALPVEGIAGSYDPETAMQTVTVSGDAEVAIKYVQAGTEG